jgi:hypothetical protein
VFVYWPLAWYVGKRLFNSSRSKLLSESEQDLEALANAAYHRGLNGLLSAGRVKEVRFPGDRDVG